jgi:hypothetical protein
MNLIGSVSALLHTFGSGQSILIAWLCVLALAVLVFLVLLAVGVHSGGRGRRRAGPEHQAAVWQQFFTTQAHSGHHSSPERHRHERR